MVVKYFSYIHPDNSNHMAYQRLKIALIFLFVTTVCFISYGQRIKWSKDGNSYFRVEQNEIVQYTMPEQQKKVIVSKKQLTPAGRQEALPVNFFSFSDDQQKALIFTNTKKVWRINTRGDYWVLDLATNSLTKLGKSRPESSLMFAKFSPDGSHVAYLSE